MCNIMVDLETLGTTPGAQILAIAAVPFASPFALEPFYDKINVDTYIPFEGFHQCPKTIEWWMKQSEEARSEAFSGTSKIVDSLTRFSEYLKSLPTDPVIWGNGADFDNPILAFAYDLVGMSTPWKYTNNRCYRTLKNLYPQLPYIPPKIKHNALQDAQAQADHATRIFAWMAAKGC